MADVFRKDPDAALDYTVDWTNWLGSDDVIVSASAIVPDGLTLISQFHSPKFHTIWLSGGTANKAYTVTSRVRTEDSRRDDRSFTLRIVEK